MSFAIREATPHVVELSAAILVYGAKRPYSSATVADFATMHHIAMREDGSAQIGPGQPLDQRNILELTMQLAGHARIRNGLLSSNILSLGMNHVMWWVPPSVRAVFFTAAGENRVGTRSGKTPHPGLIFLAYERRLYVYAVKTNTRPAANTALYHAPYFNIWESGQVCTGSTPLPDESIVTTMQAWEEGFFGSNFSHTNHDRTVRFDGGAHPFWTAMLDGKFKTFPTKVLVLRRRATVGRLIDDVESGVFDRE